MRQEPSRTGSRPGLRVLAQDSRCWEEMSRTDRAVFGAAREGLSWGQLAGVRRIQGAVDEIRFRKPHRHRRAAVRNAFDVEGSALKC